MKPKYETPKITKLHKMTFPMDIIEKKANQDETEEEFLKRICKQCSSCHNCR